ncbi:MAG: DUF421 domain-containing protein [Gaiellaceae bacterium]
MWHGVWHLGIPVAEKAVRTAVVYAAILFLIRVAGKRSLASLNSFDFVVLLLLSNVVQNAIIGNDTSLTGGLLGAAILLALNWILVRLTFLHPMVTRLLQGSPTMLYRNGRVDVAALRREAITELELIVAVRHQGMELSDLEELEIEPEGVLNARPKAKPGIEDVLKRLDELERRLGRA